MEINHYGIALSSYTIGYIYKEYAEHLCNHNDNIFIECFSEEDQRFLVSDLAASYDKAVKEFRTAFNSFR